MSSAKMHKHERLYQSKLLNTSQSQLNSGSEGDMSTDLDLITWIKVAVSSQNIWDSHLKCLHYDTNDHISLHERRLFLFFLNLCILLKVKCYMSYFDLHTLYNTLTLKLSIRLDQKHICLHNINSSFFHGFAKQPYQG